MPVEGNLSPSKQPLPASPALHTWFTLDPSWAPQDNQFTIAELDIIRKFVPSAVFKQIEDGTLTYVNEMRALVETDRAWMPCFGH